MSPEQSRAARGWLAWSQRDLAEHSRVGLSTIKDFEGGNRTPINANLDAIRRAFEEAGLRLQFSADRKPIGVAVADDAEALKREAVSSSGTGAL
jgi:transcriptional regulator with XRE-family HTH domain